MEYCQHDSNTWEIDEEGFYYCEVCESGVCPDCGALFQDMGLHKVDTLEPILEPPCNCNELPCNV